MALLKLDNTITKIDKENRDKVWQINVPDFTSVGECEWYEKIKTVDDPTVDTFAGHEDSFYYVAERTYCHAMKNYRYYWTVSLTDKKPSDFMQVYTITDGDYAGNYYNWNGQISKKASIQRWNTDVSYDYSYEYISLPTDTSTAELYNHKDSFNYICGKEGRIYKITRDVESKTEKTYKWTQEDHTQTIMSLNFFYDTCIQLTNGTYWIPTSTQQVSTGTSPKIIYSGKIVNSPDYESQTPAMHVVTSKNLPTRYPVSGTYSDDGKLVYDFLNEYGLTPKYSLSFNEYFYKPNSDNNKGTIYEYKVDYAEDESSDCWLIRTTVTNNLTLTTNQCWKIIDSDNDSHEGLSIVYFNTEYRISSQTRTVAETADYCTSPLTMPTDDSTVIFSGHDSSFIYWDNSSSSFYDVTLTTGEKTNTTYTWSELPMSIVWTDPCNEYIYITSNNTDYDTKYWLSTNTLYTPNTQTPATVKTSILNIDDSFKEQINGGSGEYLEGHSENFTYFVPLQDASGNPLSSGYIYQAMRSQTNDWGQEFIPIPWKATEVYKVSGGDVNTGYITKTGQVITSLKGTNGKDKIINYIENDNN